jgi:hypothetical protein
MILPQPKVFGLIGVSILTATQIGCRAKQPLVVINPDKFVTISVDADRPGKCEVDFPVTLVRSSKHNSVTWQSEDNNYWIRFDPTLGSPFDPANKAIAVTPTAPSTRPVPTSPNVNYYKYAIYLADPDTDPHAAVCKTADDDRDTGVNVKR